MKTLITLLLVIAIAILALPLSTRAEDAPPPKPDAIGAAPVLLGMLVITVAVTATIVVIKLHSTQSNDINVPIDVVLEKSDDHATWIPVYTNRVVLAGQSPIEFFTDEQKSGFAFYRARKL